MRHFWALTIKLKLSIIKLFRSFPRVAGIQAALASCAALLLLSACGNTSEDDSLRLTGVRYKVKLSRAADEIEWVEVKGTQEWWIFGGGVFRQIGSQYVEPQFYGDNQACNGTGSGSFEVSEIAGEKRKKVMVMRYDGRQEGMTGLCRMEDGELQVTLQPSGAVDVLDLRGRAQGASTGIVQRWERMENL